MSRKIGRRGRVVCAVWQIAGKEEGNDTKEGRSQGHRGRSKRRKRKIVGPAGVGAAHRLQSRDVSSQSVR